MLIEMEKGLIGIEIKARDTIHARDLTAMKTLAKHLKSRWLGGWSSIAVTVSMKLPKTFGPCLHTACSVEKDKTGKSFEFGLSSAINLSAIRVAKKGLRIVLYSP